MACNLNSRSFWVELLGFNAEVVSGKKWHPFTGYISNVTIEHRRSYSSWASGTFSVSS